MEEKDLEIKYKNLENKYCDLESKYDMLSNKLSNMKLNDLELVFLNDCFENGYKINEELNLIRGTGDYNYVLNKEQPRFEDSSSKVVYRESVRDKDLFIVCDPTDYSGKIKNFHGMDIPLIMDVHGMDVFRAISANRKHAKRLNIVMPFLIYGRQHKRKMKEGLDCATYLQILKDMGVENIFTFDIHDTGMLNSLPLDRFENAYPTDYMINGFIDTEDIDIRQTIIVAPDGGATERAEHFSERFLYTEVGSFYKKRDLTKIVDGQAPKLKQKYGGEDVTGKNVILVDDMISSGGSIIDAIKDLKNLGAAKVYVFVTFALFTNEKRFNEFEELYNKGILDKIYTTNYNYLPDYIKNRPWIHVVNCYNQMANLINACNERKSLSPYLGGIPNSTETIEKVKKYVLNYDNKIK